MIFFFLFKFGLGVCLQLGSHYVVLNPPASVSPHQARIQFKFGSKPGGTVGPASPSPAGYLFQLTASYSDHSTQSVLSIQVASHLTEPWRVRSHVV